MELDAAGTHLPAGHAQPLVHQLPSQPAAMLTREHAPHMHRLVARLAVQPQIRAKLQFNASTRKVDDTTTSGNAFIGKALTVASADGDLIQVELNFDLGKQST